MKFTRDSVVLWLGIVAGLVMFLAGQKPVWEWGYYDWLAAAGFVVATVSGKLATSPLPGENDGTKVKLPIAPLMLALLMASGLSACGGRTPAITVPAVPAVSVEQRAEILVRVRQAGEVVAQAQQIEIALYRSGVAPDALTREWHITIQETLVSLSVAVQAAAGTLATMSSPQPASAFSASLAAELGRAETKLAGLGGDVGRVMTTMLKTVRVVLGLAATVTGAIGSPPADPDAALAEWDTVAVECGGAL